MPSTARALDTAQPAHGTQPGGYALFATDVGRVGVAWSGARIRVLQLPAVRDDDTLARLAHQAPGLAVEVPPAAVRAAMDRVAGHVAGALDDFADLDLDLDRVPPFHRAVYVASRRVTPGHTATYGEIAAQIGSPGGARAVGQALARNPIAIVVPCHRILAAGGRPGGFSAPGALDTKARLLAIEGVALVVPPPPPVRRADPR